MRVVLDTNVIVSGLLTPKGPCARILDAVRDGLLTPLFDVRTLAELTDVLRRPRLGLPADRVDAVVSALVDAGERAPLAGTVHELPDPDDMPFLEVAAHGRADALVTGNRRHFMTTEVPILSPRQLVDLLDLRP